MGKQYIIGSSHGELTINAEGYVIDQRLDNDEPDGGGHLKSITRFDLAEWRRHWKQPLPATFDILDLSYWYVRPENDETAFEPADEKWRGEVAEIILERQRAGGGGAS